MARRSCAAGRRPRLCERGTDVLSPRSCAERAAVARAAVRAVVSSAAVERAVERAVARVARAAVRARVAVAREGGDGTAAEKEAVAREVEMAAVRAA